jgi:hypothetical protein
VKVLAGIECETVEGVHVLAIFDDAEAAESMQEFIYSALPDLKNPPGKFGDQLVVTAEAEFIRYNDRLLLAPTSLTIEEIVQAARERGGLAIPSHVDRTAYGLYGVLGFIPEEPDFPAVEISRNITVSPQGTNILILRSSFLAIPVELQDAALIDGCSVFGFFWRILLPLSRPALAAVAALTMIVSWNDLLVPLVVLDKDTLWTLPLGTMQFQGQYGQDLALVAAFLTLSAIPTIIFYILAERQIVSGLTAGALKG